MGVGASVGDFSEHSTKGWYTKGVNEVGGLRLGLLLALTCVGARVEPVDVGMAVGDGVAAGGAYVGANVKSCTRSTNSTTHSQIEAMIRNTQGCFRE
jgi:hypothetical protein